MAVLKFSVQTAPARSPASNRIDRRRQDHLEDHLAPLTPRGSLGPVNRTGRNRLRAARGAAIHSSLVCRFDSVWRSWPDRNLKFNLMVLADCEPTSTTRVTI